jgi:hypothetical protein
VPVLVVFAKYYFYLIFLYIISSDHTTETEWFLSYDVLNRVGLFSWSNLFKVEKYKRGGLLHQIPSVILLVSALSYAHYLSIIFRYCHGIGFQTRTSPKVVSIYRLMFLPLFHTI